MLRAKLIAAVAALAAAAAVPVAAASAAQAASAAVPVLTLNALGGPPANPGDLLAASLLPGSYLQLTTAPGSSTGLICRQSTWQGQLLSNPAVPGPAVIRVIAPFTIALCTDSNPTVTGVTSVAVGGLPEILQINGASPFPIQLLPSGPPLTITANLTTTAGPVTCVYQAAGPIVGNTALGSAPLVFTNQPFNLVSGPLPPCGTTPRDYFSAQYYPLLDTTAGNAQVYVN